MTRIFVVLAWTAALCVAANLILGLSLGDLRQRPSDETKTWASVHRLFGVGAGLAVVFVNSIVVTYFVGTSRWCKEASDAYRLDDEFVRRATALKRRTFPCCVLAMLTAVAIVALGGAADPGSMRGSERWVTPHLIGSIVGLALIAWTSVLQWNNIHANHDMIRDVMSEVKRIRQARGLEV